MTSGRKRHLERPPINEVVCGIQFEPLAKLLAPHLGVFWNKLGPDYPTCVETMPLPTIVENLDQKMAAHALTFSGELMMMPPLARVWFVSKEENNLVQVQRERFLCNWRRIRAEDDYPHYENVRDQFLARVEQFMKFTADHALGAIDINQLELTYIDHIPQGEAWRDLGSLEGLFPNLAWGGRHRVLGMPEGFRLQTSFELDNRSGRLHSDIKTAIRATDNTPVIVLEMTARGIGATNDLAAVKKWLDQAHEKATELFWDLTSDDVRRNVWGEKP